MIRHGVGERIEDTADPNDWSQLVVLERHRFAYHQVMSRVTGKKVLEIGCGTAYGTRMLAESAREIIALDTDPELIAHLAKGQTERLAYRWYDGQALPFLDGCFDNVVSFQVIEHVDDDAAFLREIKRVLKVKGRAFLTTPNRLLRLLPGQAPFNHYHVREYTPQELRALATETGFQVRLEGIRGDPGTQALELERLRIYHHWVFRHVIQRIPVTVQQAVARTLRSSSLGRLTRKQRDAQELRFYRVHEPDGPTLDQSIDLWLELEKVSA